MSTRSTRWFPHVTVAAVVSRDGRYLLVRERHDNTLLINQPAGHVEQGETFQHAIIREVHEETGWKFAPDYLIGVYHFAAANGKTYIRFAYAGKLLERDDSVRPDPVIEEVLWLGRDAIECGEYALRNDVVLRCINDLERGCRLPHGAVQSYGL